MQGRFITFEGADGCGKTTQLELLHSALTALGIPCRVTREPGGSTLGKEIRKTLLDPDYPDPPVPTAEILLFLADRAQHMETVIQPAMDRGFWVLCDRHTDSTLVYQGFARGYDLQTLRDLNRIAVGGIRPDITLLFDLPAEVRAARKSPAVGEFGTEDRLEQEGETFQAAVRLGFLRLAEEEPDRIAVFDAAPAPEIIHARVMERLTTLLPRGGSRV